MNDTSSNPGSEERNGRGPSGLPIPGPAPSTSELRRRATAYFDREMGPAETIDFQTSLLADDRALREFEMTRRAIEHLKTGRPAPDLTGSILDEVERRRRLLGGHRHTRRRRLRAFSTAVGAVALMAMVFLGVESVLPRMGGAPVSKNQGSSIGPLVAVPGVSAAEGEPGDGMALQLHSPIDASRGLRWDTSGSPLLVGAETDIGRSSLPIETGSWAPLGTSGVWPSFFPNASVSRPPASAMLIEPAAPGKPAADPEVADKASDKTVKSDKTDKAKDKPEPAAKDEPKAEAKSDSKAKSPR